MPIYEIKNDGFEPIMETTFGEVQIHERRDLQRLLRKQIEIISPATLIIAEEFVEWDDSSR